MRPIPDSSLPVLEHRFANLAEALAATRIMADGAMLDLPLHSAPTSERVLLRFRIGRGRVREVVGRAVANKKRLRVVLQGFDAEVVRVAIGRLASPNLKRESERIACSILASVELPTGESVGAVLWQVGPGGAGLSELDKNLPSGKVVKLLFDDGSEPVSARVVWSVAPASGGNAGVSFVKNASSRPAIERLLRLARTQA